MLHIIFIELSASRYILHSHKAAQNRLIICWLLIGFRHCKAWSGPLAAEACFKNSNGPMILDPLYLKQKRFTSCHAACLCASFFLCFFVNVFWCKSYISVQQLCCFRKSENKTTPDRIKAIELLLADVRCRKDGELGNQTWDPREDNIRKFYRSRISKCHFEWKNINLQPVKLQSKRHTQKEKSHKRKRYTTQNAWPCHVAMHASGLSKCDHPKLHWTHFVTDPTPLPLASKVTCPGRS